MDAENSGIDLCDRLISRQRKNFGELDFNYLKPGTHPDKEPYISFTLNMRTSQQYVPSSLVLGHLQRFMHLSVLRGNDPVEEPSFIEMKNELELLGSVDIVRPNYQKLKNAIYSLDVDTRELNMPISEVLRSRGIELRPYE